ncbi:hypothetical protein D1007_09947 [Hordeum vulgare]|nr:hypothetical protein D1007_09947 [Hordeum vulgare]
MPPASALSDGEELDLFMLSCSYYETPFLHAASATWASAKSYPTESRRRSRRDDCVFLEGPSGAKNLELIADYVMVYRMDIKWYPTFSKLKTLLLGHWCMDDDFYGLIYFLKNSPILERFTLELYKPFEHAYGIMSGTYQPKDQVLVSKHLKAFEINHSACGTLR